MRPTRTLRLALLAAAVSVGATGLTAAPATAGSGPTKADLQSQLNALVAAEGGPPGAIVTLRQGRQTTVFTAGVANVQTGAKPRPTDHMRIASVAKAFSGAVALNLVGRGKLELRDRIGDVLPGLPSAWHKVRLRQLLNHTSGVPDYTESDGFREQFQGDPQGYVSPAKLISWVEDDELEFDPGSSYRYSNTDNIVVGLMAQKVTGRSYGKLLRKIVFRPLGLQKTSLPNAPPLPEPYIHGYVVAPGRPPEDVSTLLNPSGAWASGAIVSTPRDLGTFMRGYLGTRLFPAFLQRQQLRLVPGGQSSPPGPGANSAGLAVFRYQTRCGAVYGHTGNFPGYTQFAAATRDGKRAVTTSLNIPAPSGELLQRLRAMQETAVCLLL